MCSCSGYKTQKEHKEAFIAYNTTPRSERTLEKMKLYMPFSLEKLLVLYWLVIMNR